MRTTVSRNDSWTVCVSSHFVLNVKIITKTFRACHCNQVKKKKSKTGLNLTKHKKVRMYLENSLKLVLTKRSITVSSLSPVLALQRQRRQKRQSAQWSEIKYSIYDLYQIWFILFDTSPVLYFLWSEDVWNLWSSVLNLENHCQFWL